ncbi:AraC family transcriptional regulator [Kutzneria sp. NPDC052558]|uniref:AraC family transcriptional regulator n=1 Tax=Kutzneria sp. NPDC052558 TaxID=3364121 RepID=UPI0037C6557E
MDVVSDVITVLRTGRSSSNRTSVDARWQVPFEAYEGAGFHILLRGTCSLISDVADPVRLGVGDVVLLPHGSAHGLAGDGTELLCGKYRLDRSRPHPLLSGLPEIIHLPATVGRHPELRAAIDLLGTEVEADRSGRDAVVSGLLDLLLVYMLRAWLEDNPTACWSQALSDPAVAGALRAIHDDPARPWTVPELAAAVGHSRATLARRFVALVGQPPMAYLTWWRMTRAARLLRDSDAPLSAIARQVGYESPFAFSHAFKRLFGQSPNQYRLSEVS